MQEEALHAWIKAARPEKNLPMLLLPAIGALVHGREVWWAVLAAATTVLFAVLIGCTYVNTWTDRALDERSKPEQAATLRRAIDGRLPWLAAFSMAAVAPCVVYVTNENACLTWALGAIALFGLLYSFDLFRWRAETRWKSHWFTHAASFIACYVLMLVLGFHTSAPHMTRGWPLFLFVGVAISDYGLVIRECTADGLDEAASGLQTLAAMFGQNTNERIALALCSVGGAVTILATSGSFRLLVAFVPAVFVRVLALGIRLPRAFEGRVVDGSFLAARLITLVALIVN